MKWKSQTMRFAASLRWLAFGLERPRRPRRKRHGLTPTFLLPFAQVLADRLQVVTESRGVLVAQLANFLNNGIAPHGSAFHELLRSTNRRRLESRGSADRLDPCLPCCIGNDQQQGSRITIGIEQTADGQFDVAGAVLELGMIDD